MKTLLVLGKASALAAAIREGLDPDHFRVIAKDEVWEAEPLLRRGAFDACILDAELTDIQPIRIVKQLLRLMPTCPVIIYSSSKQLEWEEEAYLLGVNHILSKPPRIRLLNALLDRLGPQPPAAPTAPLREPRASESSQRPVRALEVLRDFSAILTHSLFTDALLKQFLLMLREILGVNRAAIFLRRPPAALRALPVDKDESRLRPACAIGLPPDLLDYFELTLEAGIGRYVYRAGRVLKNGSDEARADLEIQKEFELLGAQVAIPILDRESLVGVAVFDGRLTGEFFANEELALIFHLLEGLGLAIKNSWLHDQLAVSHELMGDILSHLASACVVVDRNLNVLHANEAALAYFHKPERRSRALEFGDLPQILGGKVFEALNAGAELPAFKYQPPNAPERLCQATVTPFKTRRSRAADAVLLLIEDITDRERSRQLELESAGLRLIKKMAERMAHEIGNSLVPITTSHQLGEQDPKLRASISAAVAESVRRISRLTQQMFFLARDSVDRTEPVAVTKLIEEAFQEAQTNFANKAARLEVEGVEEAAPAVVRGDAASLKHAFAEVLLNALQASPKDARVKVRWRADADEHQRTWLRVDVRDAGEGFSPEAARRASEAFFTTRVVGLGLGLTVTRRIVEMHDGKLEILPARPGEPGGVSICLPVDREWNGATRNGAQ